MNKNNMKKLLMSLTLVAALASATFAQAISLSIYTDRRIYTTNTPMGITVQAWDADHQLVSEYVYFEIIKKDRLIDYSYFYTQVDPLAGPSIIYQPRNTGTYLLRATTQSGVSVTVSVPVDKTGGPVQ